MRITTKQEHLDVVCTDVASVEEGVSISTRLLMTCMLHKYNNSIGLAHNQIGGDKNVYVVKLDNYAHENDYKRSQWRSYFNATIVKRSEETTLHTEGCMSFPKSKLSLVKRHEWVVVRHLTSVGYIEEKFTGMNAIIHQHEIDHTNGLDIYKKEMV